MSEYTQGTLRTFVAMKSNALRCRAIIPGDIPTSAPSDLTKVVSGGESCHIKDNVCVALKATKSPSFGATPLQSLQRQIPT